MAFRIIDNMEEIKHRLSFGAELEFSDIDRSVNIPKELGAWEGPKIAGYALGSEIDIVNTKGEWRGIATDPLCLDCPVGGEIHVNPSYTVESQLVRIMRIIDLFPQVGVACPNHGHIHVGIQGIRQDLQAIKNIFEYTQNNQFDVLRACSGYDEQEHDKVQQSDLQDWVKDYLLIGDAKSIRTELFSRVAEAKSLPEVWKALEEVEAVNWDWVTNGIETAHGSHRTSVNLFSLLRGETVEFRVFRASINPVEIYSSLVFCQRYIEEAVKGGYGKPVLEILKEGRYKFAPLNFDEKLAKGWQETRKSKGRSGCLKKFAGVSEPTEDCLLDGRIIGVDDTFSEALLSILELCQLDFHGMKIWPKL